MKIKLLSLASTLGLISLVGLMALSSGCGPSPSKESTNILQGEVFYKGAPVPGGMVTFFPEKGGPGFMTFIRGDGSYKIGGVPPGKMKVTIDTEVIKTMAEPQVDYSKVKLPEGVQPPTTVEQPKYRPVPAQYHQVATSPLVIEVLGGIQDQNFNLVD